MRADAALRESEERFRSAFEHAAIGMALVRPDGRLLQVNPSFSQMLGYSEQELTSSTWQTITHSDDLATTHEHVRSVLAAEVESCQFEKRYFHKLGHEVWGLLSFSLVRDADGSPLYFISQIQDITERKRSEEALRERTHDLGERVKELHCLYAIAQLIDKPDVSLEEIAQGTADLIPPSWQYPEVTCARILLEGREFRTENFRESPWSQTADITVRGEPIGAVEVFYVDERPESNEGPFLKEERCLIDAIALRMGKVVDRKRTEEALQKAREELEGKVEHQMLRRNPYRLTFRELTVLHLVASGRSDREIGITLSISHLTAQKHISNILTKMDAASRTEAAARAIREGLLE